MRKRFLVAAVVTALLAFFCLVPVEPARAVELGSGFAMDGYFTGGKLWDLDHQNENITLSTREGEWFVDGEVGFKYKFLRPFIAYTNFNHNYSVKTGGIDILAYELKGIAMGFRTTYNYVKRIGIDSQESVYTGLLVKF